MGEDNMEIFLLGILFSLGPSVVAFAWLIWYSSTSENSDHEERHEPDEIRTWLLDHPEKSVKEQPANAGLVVIKLAEVRLGRRRQFGTARLQLP
jgi:hypothetical protein